VPTHARPVASAAVTFSDTLAETHRSVRRSTIFPCVGLSASFAQAGGPHVPTVNQMAGYLLCETLDAHHRRRT
jgi:hypothetical protein